MFHETHSNEYSEYPQFCNLRNLNGMSGLASMKQWMFCSSSLRPGLRDFKRKNGLFYITLTNSMALN